MKTMYPAIIEKKNLMQENSILNLFDIYKRNKKIALKAINRCDIKDFYRSARKSKSIPIELRAEVVADAMFQKVRGN